jgi:hypothetical protein
VKVALAFIMTGLMILLWACSDSITPTPSVSHPDGWNDLNSEVFHGSKVLVSGAETCRPCHGDSYTGGQSGVSCYQCHASYPHHDEWTTPGSGHDAYIKTKNWSLADCKSCHGTDYQGGSSGESCLTCHTSTAGPEACNTCHGSIDLPDSDLLSWAPPEDLKDKTVTTSLGVGAHQNHLTGTAWSTAYTRDCAVCHPVLTGFSDPAHIDKKSGVDMHFGTVATWDGNVSPQWDHGSATCAGMYCHGNFSFSKSESSNQWGYESENISGNNLDMIWNEVGTGQSACGTCHGLPPAGHVAATACNACHGSVIGDNNVIIDKRKHINGQVDLN